MMLSHLFSFFVFHLSFLCQSILPPIFMIYAPLFLSNCESLSSRFNEFQMQISLVSIELSSSIVSEETSNINITHACHMV